MTKFILVGGYPRKAPDGGKALVEEMTKGFNEPVKLLLCYFARPKEHWEQNLVEDRIWFESHLQGKKVEYQIAQVETFIKQIKWSDTIYLRGGLTEELLKFLNECKGWDKELEGKTLAGTSAGAIAIATYSYDLDTHKGERGLALLPIKVLSHYRSNYNGESIDWDKVYSELKEYKEDLPILTLEEGQFEVIYT